MSTVSVNIDDFSRYFSIQYAEFNFDILSAVFLFASGQRPVEFLNTGVGNILLPTSEISFNQAKGGGRIKRTMDLQLLTDITDLWSSVGNPKTYYGSYSSVLTYLRRAIDPNFSVSNRLDELYNFRYGCCACLEYQGATDAEIDDFFQHTNKSNTQKYKSMGQEINDQLN